MTNLKDGVDMVTVCVVIMDQCEKLLTLWHSTWVSTRKYVLDLMQMDFADPPSELCTTFALHRKL